MSGRHWRVGEFRSSADPDKTVLCVFEGDCIAHHEKHHSFIRWIAGSDIAARQPVAVPLASPGKGEWSDGWNACREAMLRGEGEALAARQPVGEPVGYFDPDVLAHLTEGLIDPVGVLRRKPNGKSNVPVWLGPPAQAVDLAMPIAMIDQALGHLSTALDDMDSSPDRRPGAMVAEAIGCLRQALTGVRP